jgi:D-galactarolactone isomerase
MQQTCNAQGPYMNTDDAHASPAEPAPPRERAPAHACDTHLHFYDLRYPLAPTARVRPPQASVDDYRAVQRRLGLERAVIVQPSAYGKDNRCTLEGIAALGLDTARGIAVFDTSITDAELEALHRAGIRGIRFLMMPGGALPWDMLDELAARVQHVDWHVQLQMDGRDLPLREAQVMAWPGRIVIDHNGKFLEPVGTDHPGFRCLLRMLDTGRVWVKLSAPYETSRRGPPRYEDVGVLAKALVDAAPERALWASNWPHPGFRHQPPDEAALLDLLLEWAPDEATRHRILVTNPAELYGFR